MNSIVFDAIRAQVKEHGEISVALDVGHTVVFSTLNGNVPVNNRVSGTILNFPVNLKLHYNAVPNIKGNFPVNTRITGMIGDSPVDAKMRHTFFFSTIAGNIPYNTEIVWAGNGKNYRLETPYTLVTASSRAGGGVKAASKKVHGGGDRKYVAGKLKIVDPAKEDDRLAQDAGVPLIKGVYGRIDDIEVDLTFSFSYYFDTSSGRTPVNIRLSGVLRDCGK